MGMGNLQRMAMQMQQEMARIQAELAETEVEGSSGGGVVRAARAQSERARHRERCVKPRSFVCFLHAREPNRESFALAKAGNRTIY